MAQTKRLKSMFVTIPEDYLIKEEDGVLTINVIFDGPGTFAARIPLFCIQDWDDPDEDDEEIRGGESKRSLPEITAGATRVEKTLIFFNQFVDGKPVNPKNSLGVSKIQITREQFVNVPIIDLLRKAEGTAVWSDNGTTKYYIYSTYQDNGVWVINTVLQYDATLYDMNRGFDSTMYVMISTVNPLFTPAKGGIPLPPRLRF